MPPRTSWTGNLKLSLITIPVRLYRAVSTTSRVRLNMLHRDCNQRIHYQYDCAVHGTVPKEDIVKGYQYEKGRYVVLDDETLEQVKLETTKTIEVVQFVENEELDPIYLDSPYYLAPDGPVAEEAFRVLREAMRLRQKTAIGRLTMAGREHTVAISPRSKGLLLTTLHAADEIRREEPYYADVGEGEVVEEELDLARQLIDSRSRPFDPGIFRDRYEDELRQVIRAKIEGKEPEVVEVEEAGKIVDFMEALKRSLAQEEKARKPSAPRRRKEAAETQPAKRRGKT
jgi:DNA end-binding protein Ku